jgi:hypothetical protein
MRTNLHNRGYVFTGLGRYLLFFFLFFITLKAVSACFQSEAEEYNLKAAFIFNFTKFIEWDTEVLNDEFIIGIIGPSPIYMPLVEISHVEKVNGKKIIIKKFNSVKDATFCHIVFIAADASVKEEELLLMSANKGTLTISEKKELSSMGTAINFMIVNHKLKFELNSHAINSTGLKVSSQLMKLSILID